MIRAKEAAENLLSLDAELARWPALRRVVGERFAQAEALTRAG